jgi:CPA1 family monovalent cation:H+ antiporter
MVAQVPIFAGLSSGQFDGLSRLLRPLFVVPGERIIRRGAVGDAIYFIASGAVEVAVPGGKVRLGRGDFVGEMALLSGRPRQSDVHAIGYCSLLRLDVRDFERFLDENPDLRGLIESVATRREAENVAGPGGGQPAARSMSSAG